jgi:hypothetical protein
MSITSFEKHLFGPLQNMQHRTSFSKQLVTGVYTITLGRKRVAASMPNDKLCQAFAVAVSDSIAESLITSQCVSTDGSP